MAEQFRRPFICWEIAELVRKPAHLRGWQNSCGAGYSVWSDLSYGQIGLLLLDDDGLLLSRHRIWKANTDQMKMVNKKTHERSRWSRYCGSGKCRIPNKKSHNTATLRHLYFKNLLYMCKHNLSFFKFYYTGIQLNNLLCQTYRRRKNNICYIS